MQSDCFLLQNFAFCTDSYGSETLGCPKNEQIMWRKYPSPKVIVSLSNDDAKASRKDQKQ